ncbi:N-6 DNA methylase [Clostridium sp. LBM24168]
MANLRSNERSEAIELIKQSQMQFEHSDLVFKSASGELTLDKSSGDEDRRNKSLFPDVVFFSDKYRMNVLLGWELKMPDTDITNSELISNAKDKAERLGTSVFVIWNFRHVSVYHKSDVWKLIKTWMDLDDIRDREQVRLNEKRWIKLLKEVNLYLNKLFIENRITEIPLTLSLKSFITDIADKYSIVLRNHYLGLNNRSILAKIKLWYDNEKVEFSLNASSVKAEEKVFQFSKNILIKWLNRITFSCLIRTNYNSINEILHSMFSGETVTQISQKFNAATEITDFYTIFHADGIESEIPEGIFSVITQYAYYLFQKDFSTINTEEFQKILENSIQVSKRELMGLYTTPKELAELLVKCTISDMDKDVYDPTTGSGTIAAKAMDLVSSHRGMDRAHELIWASDKYDFPLQIANLSMSSKESIHLINKVFRKNIFSVRVGDKVSIVDPNDGLRKDYIIPKFGSIVANLPFIRSEKISPEDAEYRVKINSWISKMGYETMNLKSDLYQFILIYLYQLLDEYGRVGVIVSNSWMKTKKKKNFYNILSNFYNVQSVIISSGKKWFDNSDVITTLLILCKKNTRDRLTGTTKFIKISKNLCEIGDSINSISDSILLNIDIPDEFGCEYSYSETEIKGCISSGLSLNILFSDVSWFQGIKNILIPMKSVFNSKRGTKSGNNSFFYNIDSSEGIEQEFIISILSSSDSITGFFATHDSNAFDAKGFSKEELDSFGKSGALGYIEKYEKMPKSKTQNMYDRWYQLPKATTGDFVTSINPDQRLFWSRIPDDLYIDQRLCVFSLKDGVTCKKKLLHALLNTYIGQFFIEATGFGRGLGVLDTTKDGLLDGSILDYNLLSCEDKTSIMNIWEKLSLSDVPTVTECLSNSEWIHFNKLVFKAFKCEGILPKVMNTLKQAIELRKM